MSEVSASAPAAEAGASRPGQPSPLVQRDPLEAPALAGPAWGRADALVAGAGFLVRGAVALWAGARFPPAADGTYYARLAERIASGQGSTWRWPDGAVTYAAHYPVGYPGFVALIWRLFGPSSWAALFVVQAALGALGALAVHRLARHAGARRGALLAGLLVALHPSLVLYTPAVMTEGVSAALLALGAWLAASARASFEVLPASGDPQRRRGAHKAAWGRVAGLGVVLGLATLVRPQVVVLLPLLGLLAAPARWSWRRALLPAALASLLGLAVVAPWTARNCARMGQCALVSVNGGWNLLIGADAASTGAWSPVQVPEACRTVWDEAGKDACFGREARSWIVAHPWTWLGLVPRKLAATFDRTGAAGYYLHASNPEAFGEGARKVLDVAEILVERGALLLAFLGLGGVRARQAGEAAWARGRGREGAASLAGRLELGLVVVGLLGCFFQHAWLSYLALALLLVARPARWRREPLLGTVGGLALLCTLLTHSVFFGAGRYALVVLPLVSAQVAWLGVRVGGRPREAPLEEESSLRRSL
jgi:4-amino-4-deoxy-L-arabinose transferase-like glycosyltransferase